MTISYEHPNLVDMTEEYIEINDVHNGQRAIKNKTIEYLPATSGHYADGYGTHGTKGQMAYDAYLKRAVFPSTFDTAVRRILGILHKNPPNITLPDSMKSLLGDATGDGTNIQEFIRAVNKEQLTLGRCAILADIQVKPDTTIRPVLKIYKAPTVLNWGQTEYNKTNYVVLNESGLKLNSDSFNYEEVKQYRVLRLMPDEHGEMVYHTSTSNDADADVNELDYFAPNSMGMTLKNKIPVAFCNAGDTLASISNPPLLELKNLMLVAYRASADYRQSLFDTASETLVISGRAFGSEEEDIRVGTGSVIELQNGGKADYIGPNSKSIPEQRTAIDSDMEKASQLATQLAIQSKSSRESGESISARMESATAAYSALAITGAAAIEQALRNIAPLFGVKDPDKEISVLPNMEFASLVLPSDTFVDLQAAKMNGLKISDKSMHENLRKVGATELSFEEELAHIAAEENNLFDE